MTGGPFIEFDVETTGVQWYAHDLFMVQFHSPELLGDEPVWFRHPEDRAEIQRVLDMDAHFRAWNAKFDLAFLKAAGYRLPAPDRWHDAMVASRLLDEQRPAALKRVGEMMFGPEASDPQTQVKGWLNAENTRRRKESKETGEEFVPANYSDVPLEIMVPYAVGDVVLQRRVAEVQYRALAQSDELVALYEMEMEVMAALFEAEQDGIPIDEAAARRLEIALVAEMEELEDETRELAGIDTFNPRSSQQLYKALQRLGADLSFVTGTSMDAENLATVDHPLARKIEQYRSTHKLLTSYVRPMLHRRYEAALNSYKEPFIVDGRIHSNFRQIGADTGRMSSADPNVQNFPRDDLRLRYLVRAEPGNKIVTVDLDSIEFKLFAAYAGEGRLLDMARDPDADPHSDTANRIGLQDFVRQGGHIESKRQRGKRFNYLVLFGGGVRAIRKWFLVSQKEGRRMLDSYHKSYPEVGRLQRRIEYALYERGYTKNAYGRRYHLDPRHSYKGPNYVVQGTAADLLKKTIVRLRREGIKITIPVHDEIVWHGPEEDAERVAAAIVEAFTDHPELGGKVPITAEAQIVDRWSQAKDPDYVPEYDKIKEVA